MPTLVAGVRSLRLASVASAALAITHRARQQAGAGAADGEVGRRARRRRDTVLPEWKGALSSEILRVRAASAQRGRFTVHARSRSIGARIERRREALCTSSLS